MKKIFLTSIFAFLFIFSVAGTAGAVATSSDRIATSSDRSSAATTVSLPNPLGTTDVNQVIANMINFILSLVGSVSLILFIYGGITWMTSAGAPAQVKKGKDIVVWAIIGLAVVFTSYILVKFVIQGVTYTGA